MTRRSSTVRAAAALSGFATAAALTLATPTLATPTPATASPGAAPAGTAAPETAAPETATAETATADAVVAQHSVTLISGDRVLLQRLAGGNDVATIQPNTARPGVSYATREVDDQVYVIPTDAMPLLAAGKLDEQLFNVSGLVANGYDDSASDSIGLIVGYQPGVATAGRAAAPPGSRPELTLESINAQSVREDKAKAHDFWAGLAGAPDTGTGTGTGTGTMAGQIRKIWLNRTVRVSLAESVPQVGAPQAWAAGFDGTGTRIAVLDTGVDATHPDLDAGKVVAAANFSTDADTLDHHGHGTHVASIAAGTGEAAATSRKGVAPGASVINAKVLDSGGSGDFAGIIEGLEWAAAQGADVANMSLGTGSPSDGNDPLVQAVNEISTTTGMLVVVAAGNLGSGESTIASPGWADEALTVGAVSKQDELAWFSSRGPRLGDYGIKPDLTGPGVDIVAARAEGTALGPVVDERYVTLSGTSMATPHVAGAAALLAQAFPGYTHRQLKDALVATAHTIGGQSVYQQGGGRLDVARAVRQRVHASPGTLDLGNFPFPHDGQAPVTRTVSYTNETTADVTLNLSLEMSGRDSGPAPAGMFRVSQPSVTVPAAGTASVEVTVDPAAGALDLYGGYLVATSGETVVHSSIGAYVEPEMYNLTVSGIARDGRPAAVISWAELWSLENGAFTSKYYSRESNTVTFRVPPGTYNLAGYLGTADAPNVYATEVSMVNRPQLEVTGDASIVLDASGANEVTFDTQRPAAPSWFAISYHRGASERTLHSSLTAGWPIDRAFATPTQPVTEGDFEFYTKWRMIAPPIRAEVTGPQRIPLDPQYMSNALRIDGTYRLPLVYVGFGRPQEYAGVDVRGKIALISRGAAVPFVEKVRNATAAGAWGAVIFNNVPGLLLASAGNPGEVGIPAWTIEQAPGLMLVDLLRQAEVRAEFSGTSVSPYAFDLLEPHQAVPTSMHYTIGRTNTAQVDSRYVGDSPGQHGTDVRHAFRPYPTFSAGFADDLPRPLDRTEWVTANDTQWWHLAWANAPFDGEFRGFHETVYSPRDQLPETWFGGVRRPAVAAWWPVTRTGDDLDLSIFPFVDSDGHACWSVPLDVQRTSLYGDGRLLAESAAAPFGRFRVLPGTASYRLEYEAKRSAPWWSHATETRTAWTFTSSRPAEDTEELPPLLQVDYDLQLDGLNRAPDHTAYSFTIGAGHQPGADGPAVTLARAWVSFDDGNTWAKIDLVALGNGQWRATVLHPRAADTSGAVSLRVSANDAAGNAIDQTVLRAYGLAA